MRKAVPTSYGIYPYGHAQSLLSSCNYHHYNEERLVSPNNYYSKTIANEAVSATSQQSQPNLACPNTRDIQFMKSQLATALTTLEALKNRPSSSQTHIAKLDETLGTISLQLSVNALLMILFYVI